MTPQSIRHMITVIARVVSITLLVFLPLGFGVVAYRATVADTDYKAKQHAARIAKYAFQHTALWEFHGARLSDLIELPPAVRPLHRQSIISASGRVIVAEPHALARPSFTYTEPLIIAGMPMGELRIETSLRPQLMEFLTVLLIAILLSGLVIVGFRLFPLRLIDRMLGDLNEERGKTVLALDELATAETKLRERTDQLVEAQEIGRIGDWSMTVGEKHLFLSPVALALLRIDPKAFEPRRSMIASLLVGDGAARAEALINEVIATNAARHLDLQFRRGDGSIADLAVTCRVAERRNGQIHRLAGTVQDVTDRVESQRQLERLAYFDPLTGLANRAMFQDRLDQEVAITQQNGSQSALLLVDLDRFKEVNDTLGHAAGDELLVRMSQRLRQEIGETPFIARLGGDEFAIILPGFTDVQQVETLAGQIVTLLGQSINLGNVEISTGASIGVALLPEHGTSGDDVSKKADMALYRAKDAGRGRFVIFEPSMMAAIQQRIELGRDLKAAAAANDGLEVWLQPQVALSSSAVLGFEALMRWHHPVRGMVPPSEFIPIAESSNLICDLGLWILRDSVRIVKRWIDAGGTPFEVAVNLSPAQLRQGRIEDDVAAILAETGLPPHLLCLELTESMLVDHAEERVRTTLHALKKLGVKLALDDFGTGYSSLGYLIQLPFDKLKVDRIFVAEAARSEKGRHVLKGIIALGHGLGMTVVAEGVETMDELEQLARFGCDEIQGYLIARPQPAAAALAFALNSIMQQGRGLLPEIALRPDAAPQMLTG